MTLTQIYQALSDRLGKDAAQDITNYIETKVSTDLQAATRNLSTTEALTETRTALKTEIAETRTALKTEIAETRTALKTEIAETRTELKTEIAKTRTELKTEIAETRTEARLMNENLKTFIAEHIAISTRWMLGTILTLVLMMIGLYVIFIQHLSH